MPLFNLIYVGNYPVDLDPLEPGAGGSLDSESKRDLLGQTFTPSRVVQLSAPGAGPTASEPWVFDRLEQTTGYAPQTVTYNLGSGQINTFIDGTINDFRVTVRLANGGTTERIAAFVQMENGDLFIADNMLFNEMSNLDIQSVTVNSVLATAVDRLWFDQGVTGTTVVGTNAPPTFTNVSNGQTINVAENTAFVVDANATDPNNDTLTYSISGGADAGRFTIDPATGVLRFVTAPDFEGARSSVGNDQIYDVTIRVSDGRYGHPPYPFVCARDVKPGVGSFHPANRNSAVPRLTPRPAAADAFPIPVPPAALIARAPILADLPRAAQEM